MKVVQCSPKGTINNPIELNVKNMFSNLIVITNELYWILSTFSFRGD
jgi:hypothetical protein